MDNMLRRQDEIEVCRHDSPIGSHSNSHAPHKVDCDSRLSALHQNLVAIEDLIRQFNAYRLSYGKLLIEIARRRQYKEAAENIVRSMVTQLEAMSDGMFLFLRPAH